MPSLGSRRKLSFFSLACSQPLLALSITQHTSINTMPPRIQPHRVSIPSSCQCFRTRPQCQAPELTVAQTRQLHKAGLISPKMTRLRRNMIEWLEGPGKAFYQPLPSSTNYMSAYDRSGNLVRVNRQARDNQSTEEDVIPESMEEEIQRKEIEQELDEYERQERFQKRQAARDQKADLDARGGIPKERLSDMRPYPLNQNFRSEPVLSEDLREMLYTQVVGRGIDVSTVSAVYGVDKRRVAAVVRLKTIEKQWEQDGKKLAKPYHDALMAMLPQTSYRPDAPTEKIVPHEGINDLPVHPHTRQQIFWPTSESRHFTREDAAKAFNNNLLPADKRIAHPELVAVEKDILMGVARDERARRMNERDAIARQAKADAEAKRKAWEERTQRIVHGRRWDFKFQDFSAEHTGKDGRARNAVGVRYGMPHDDRKRGMVKIPTSVE